MPLTSGIIVGTVSAIDLMHGKSFGKVAVEQGSGLTVASVVESGLESIAFGGPVSRTVIAGVAGSGTTTLVDLAAEHYPEIKHVAGDLGNKAIHGLEDGAKWVAGWFD